MSILGASPSLWQGKFGKMVKLQEAECGSAWGWAWVRRREIDRPLRGLRRGGAHPEQKERTVLVFEVEPAALIPYRRSFDNYRAIIASVSKLCLLTFATVSESQGGGPAGRRPCLCRAHRHQLGRVIASDSLRPLALRAGPGAEAWRSAQRCPVQGLDAAGVAGEGASPAGRNPGWEPADGVDPDRHADGRARGCRPPAGKRWPPAIASADVILNILARSQAPAPSGPAQTPERLQLKHAPLVDFEGPRCRGGHLWSGMRS
jgi:hypothetical protein